MDIESDLSLPNENEDPVSILFNDFDKLSVSDKLF